MKSLIQASLSIICVGICSILSAQTLSPFIQVDQFGYLPNDSKVAVLSNPQTGYNGGSSYTPPGTMVVKDSATGSSILTIPVVAWNGGATDTDSGDKGWWVNFSSLTTPGTYMIVDTVQNSRSAYFKIDNFVYADVLRAAGRMFFYNRCNEAKPLANAGTGWSDGVAFTGPFQDANCRYIFDTTNAALEKDLTGGWFDAGDYNKYVTFAESAIHDLLWAYRQNPTCFGDDWNIPESGNSVPDILDEIVVELEWMLKMSNPDGSVHNKMGSKNYTENTSAPPSLNTDQRYYGPTCTSASISVASTFAHAAEVLQPYPLYSTLVANLQAQAIASFAYVLPFQAAGTLQTNCDNGEIISGDADVSAFEQLERMVTAAVHLFELTGTGSYNSFVDAHFATTESIASGFTPYKLSNMDALLLYTTLSGTTPSTVSSILANLNNDLSNNWNGYFRWQTGDLYRSFVPAWTYHWGSNMAYARYSIMNSIINEYGFDAANTASYKQRAHEQLHFFHGVNPLGIVYLSNMNGLGAERSINEIYHTWFNDGTIWDNAQTSQYGPPPGYLVGGANGQFSNGSVSPPAGQPGQKSYLDFNTGWPLNSWEVSEPAIYYQASYVRMLSAIHEDPVLPVQLISFTGQAKNSTSVLTWKVGLEDGVDRYDIERRSENSTWEKIGEVGATKSNQYEFVDAKPHFGGNYYRLRIVDFDNSVEYSNVIHLDHSMLVVESVYLTPNPTTGFFEIYGADKLELVRVLDATGRFLFSVRTKTLNLRHLPSGMYLIEVHNASEVSSLKLMKK